MKKVMNVSFKIILILMIGIILFYTFGSNSAYAFDPQDTNFWDPSKNLNNDDDAKLLKIGNRIVGPIQMVGSLVSVIAIIIIGIKYMLGSIEQKAEYKKTLGPYFIGAVMVFGITNIVSIIYRISISL